MAITDIDLANLETKPFFKTQLKQLLHILDLEHPNCLHFLYTRSADDEFKLEHSAAEAVVFDHLSADTPCIRTAMQTRQKEAIWIDSHLNDAIFSSDSSPWSDQCLFSPIVDEKELMGFLLILLPRAISQDSISRDLVASVTQGIATTAITSGLLEKYKERCDQLSVMLEVNTHLNIAATKTDFLYEISRFGKYFLNFDRAVLILHPEDTPEYFTVDSIEGETGDLQLGMSYPLSNTLVSQSIISGQHLIFRKSSERDLEGIYRAGDIEERTFDQIIVFPLAKVRNAPGALVLESREEFPVREGELTIFEMISQNLGAALTRFSLYERLNNYATIDTLTHLYNLRALKQRFEEELARAKRYQSSLVILFLDLDKFKSVNDTHGHLMGDYVLKETSQIIRDSVRTSDIPGRYGGEEFVVIMLNTTAEACMAVAQRICDAIREYHFEMNQTTVQNHISIGLSEYPLDGESMSELIQSADAAMYTAKRRGGDQVVKFQKGMVPKSSH